MTIRLSIKKPGKIRRSFAVIKDVKTLAGKRIQTQVEDERLESINTNLRRGLIDTHQAHAEVKLFVAALRAEWGVKERESLEAQVGDNNIRVYHAYWKDKYEKVELANVASTRNDLLGALKAIEPLSITSASRDELRDILFKLPAHQQRRHSIRINQLLTYLERPFRIARKKRQHKEVDYVTWAELQEIIPHIKTPEVASLAVALFGTGVREGEAFSQAFARLKPNGTIYIAKQIDRKRASRDIKNGKPHHTMLLPEAKAAYLKWCAVEDKEQFRLKASQQITRAAKKAFPRRKEKQVSAHDLRHSYAIHLLGLGASLTQIAQVLGDSVSTVEKHYTGFVMTDEAVSNLQRLLPR